MKINKHAVTITLAAAGLFLSSSVLAMPGFTEDAPQSTIDVCVAQIAVQANYENAGLVRHYVESRQRRFSGHTLRIDTIVYGINGEDVIREYATICAVTDSQETKVFKIREKGSRTSGSRLAS